MQIANMLHTILLHTTLHNHAVEGIYCNSGRCRYETLAMVDSKSKKGLINKVPSSMEPAYMKLPAITTCRQDQLIRAFLNSYDPVLMLANTHLLQRCIVSDRERDTQLLWLTACGKKPCNSL